MGRESGRRMKEEDMRYNLNQSEKGESKRRADLDNRSFDLVVFVPGPPILIFEHRSGEWGLTILSR